MKEIVYIRLLGEGTEVYRPAYAENIATHRNVYFILTDNHYDTEDEEWEFPPGSYVVVETKKINNKHSLIAKSLYSPT